ncbi:MAG: N-acetyl-gamma-glutamyl-phosphate reductase [Pseudomonadota bacterium]
MAARIFIDGEAGTTGLQIRERLAGRRDLDLLSIDPSLRKDAGARRELLNAADVAILCLPDAAAREAVALIENPTTRVIDASTAHRTADGWAYGFPEMASGQDRAIARADRVANPGCYPQGFIALVRPLIEAGLVPADHPFTYNAVSGYTGGGRTMIERYEADDTTVPAHLPYGLTCNHKHLPEMTLYSSVTQTPVFLPAVGRYAQGLIGQVPLTLSALPSRPTLASLHACLTDRYQDADFIEVAPLEATERTDAFAPDVLNGTNRMRLGVFGDADDRQAVLVAVYDNLGKGASGAAVQCLNLMLGTAADAGLDLPAAA